MLFNQHRVALKRMRVNRQHLQFANHEQPRCIRPTTIGVEHRGARSCLLEPGDDSAVAATHAHWCLPPTARPDAEPCYLHNVPHSNKYEEGRQDNGCTCNRGGAQPR
jgi:hypothetical protein